MDEQNQGEQVVEEKSNQSTQETSAPEKKQTGSIIGSIIVIIVIIIGGLYFWGTKAVAPTDEAQTPPADPITMPEQDPIGDALRNTSTSDELGDIEADLNTTDIDSIDAEADQI
jgi:hypothetical protein